MAEWKIPQKSKLAIPRRGTITKSPFRISGGHFVSHTGSSMFLDLIRRVVDDPRTMRCPDQELLDRFLSARDEAAFEAILRRHGPMVLGVCCSMLPNGADAEDAFQATFLILASKAKSIQKTKSLASWLHGVAYRVARKAQTEFARRQKHESLVPIRDDPNKADELSWREVRELIHEEVNNLPDGCRSAVVLCYLEDMTQDEAAQKLSLSKGTLKGRLERGRDLLRSRLIRRGLGAGAIGIASVWPAVGMSADLSAALVNSTARVSVGLAGGQAIAGLVSPRVAALATGMLKAMFMSKIKTATAFLALVGLICVGASSLSIYLWAGPQEGEERQELVKELPQPGPVPPPGRARFDAVGDPLPPEAVARLGTLRFRHAGWVTNVAYLPGGKSVASVSYDGTVRVWDARTGKELHRFPGICCALAPDGLKLASWDHDRPIILWDIATGKQLRQWQAQTRPYCLAFSPDGKVLAAGGRNTNEPLQPVLQWDVATGASLPAPKYLRSKHDYASRLAFSPDSKVLATSSEHGGVVQFWEVATGKEVTPNRNVPEGGHQRHPPTPLAFSPDGRLMATAGEHGPLIRVWEAASGKQRLQVVFPASGLCNAVTFSPDGLLLASGHVDGLIRIWDAATGKELRVWQGHLRGYGNGQHDGVTSLVFSADSKAIISGGSDHMIRSWDVGTGKSQHPSSGHQGTVKSLTFLHDGKTVASSGEDQTIRLWNVATGKEERQFLGHLASVHAIALSPDGKTLASKSYGHEKFNTLRFWEVATGKELRRISAYDTHGPLAFSPDGQTLGVSAKDGICLLNVASARERSRLVKNGSSGTFVAFSPNGKSVAWGSFNNDDRFCLHFSDATAGKILGTVEIDTSSQANWGDFSADGETLLILMDGGISTWTMTGKRESLKFAASAKRDINCAALSGDRKTLAAGCKDGAISLWEVATGQERVRFPGHEGAARYGCQGGVASLAWSRDGKTLVSGGEDTTILVWDVATLMGQPRPVKLTPQELEGLWSDLSSNDAGKAYRAIGRLTASPQAAARYLGKQLQPKSVDPKQIARLIAELNDDRFQVRNKAAQQLAQLGPAAAGALKQALAGRPSVEVRRRIEALLEPLEAAELTTERLRAWRAIEALEYIGSADAQEVLETLSHGNDAARTALDRLRRRKTIP